MRESDICGDKKCHMLLLDAKESVFVAAVMDPIDQQQ